MFNHHQQDKPALPPRPIVLLDICSMSLIKDRDAVLSGKDGRKKERLAQITDMAQSGQYRFSLLLPILEKGTDCTNPLNAEEMVAVFKKDHAQMAGFIGSTNLVEPPEALEHMIPLLMDERFPKELRAELSIPASLALLEFYNRELKITSTPAQNARLPLAERVVAEGARLGLGKGYPTIALCVASIYGCMEARKILKIKEDGRNFNPSNCLGDIMTLYRVANARFQINSQMPDAHVIFRTEDAALESLHSWINTRVTGVTADGTMMKTTCEAPEKLFPALYKKGNCINQKELDQVYALLDYVV